MSNELTINADSPLTLPSYLQGVDTDVSANLLATVTLGGNRIGLKGSRFRLVVNGKEEGVFEENYLDVVIVGAYPATSRMYYADTYDADVKSAPTCYSADGIAPSDDVKNKQSDKCATCPMNEVGSKIYNGHKGKACAYFQRLVVMLPGDESGNYYRLDVKAMGLFGDSHKAQHKYNLKDYIKFVAARNVDIGKLVTRISFDVDASVPKLLFSANRFVTAEEFEAVRLAVTSEEVKAMVAVSMATVDLSKEEDADVPEAAPVEAAPVAAQAPKAQTPKPAAPKPQAPAVQRPAAPQVAQKPKPPAPQRPVVEDKVPAPAQAAPAVVEVESDADLAAILAELG